jgi:DNA-binding CsgD family transcriptional regulator
MSTSNLYRYVTYIDALKVLSSREIEVMDLVLKGFTSFEISKELFLSKHTVDTHKKNIARKLELEGPKAIIKWRASISDYTMKKNNQNP